MKKSLFVIIVLAMLLSVIGVVSADRLDDIKARGYIELATEPYWAPNEFIDPTKTGDEQYVGSDIELAKAIAEKIGVDLKIVPLDFSAVLVGINEGKYDIAISAIAWSPVREEAMRLSNGYEFGDTGYGFLVRAEDAGKYTSIDDLVDAVVVTQSGAVQEAIYNEYCNNAKQLKLVANMTDAYLAVAEGKADVCITDRSSGSLYAEANGGLFVEDFKFDNDPKMSAVCVATTLKGTESLMDVVNEVIAEVTDPETGKWTEWNDYFKAYAKELGLD